MAQHLGLQVEHLGYPQVRYLPRQVPGEHDVAGGEAAVDDGRVSGVEVEESARHVKEDGQLDGDIYVRVRLEALVELHVHVLRDESDVQRPRGTTVHTYELEDVGVPQFAQGDALAAEPLRQNGDLFFSQDVVS